MGPHAMTEAARRLAGMEMLLRRIHLCDDRRQAANLIANALPGLADVDWAELHVLESDASLPAAGDEHRELGIASLAKGRPCSAGGQDEPAVVAVPLECGPGARGAVVLARLDGERFHEPELRLLRLFADHASSSLSRIAQPAGAAAT
jgi:GAF domain-containing protein